MSSQHSDDSGEASEGTDDNEAASQTAQSLSAIGDVVARRTDPPSKDPDILAVEESRDYATEAADHPAITMILMIIGAVGILLICAGIALDISRPAESDKDAVSSVGNAGLVEDLILGIGIELCASALMLHVFTRVIRKTPYRMRWIFFTACAGLALTILPLFCGRPAWHWAIAIAAGVEIFGAVVIFVLLDNVTAAIAEAKSEA